MLQQVPMHSECILLAIVNQCIQSSTFTSEYDRMGPGAGDLTAAIRRIRRITAPFARDERHVRQASEEQLQGQLGSHRQQQQDQVARSIPLGFAELDVTSVGSGSTASHDRFTDDSDDSEHSLGWPWHEQQGCSPQQSQSGAEANALLHYNSDDLPDGGRWWLVQRSESSLASEQAALERMNDQFLRGEGIWAKPNTSGPRQPQVDGSRQKPLLKKAWKGLKKRVGRYLIKPAKKVATAIRGALAHDSSSTGALGSTQAVTAQHVSPTASGSDEGLLASAVAQQAQGNRMAYMCQILRPAPVDVQRPRLREYLSVRFEIGMRTIMRSALCAPPAHSGSNQTVSHDGVSSASSPNSSSNNNAATAQTYKAVVEPSTVVFTDGLRPISQLLSQGYTVVLSWKLLAALCACGPQLGLSASNGCAAIARKGCALTMKRVMQYCQQLQALGYYVVVEAATNSLYLMQDSQKRSKANTQGPTRQSCCLQGCLKVPASHSLITAVGSIGAGAVCVVRTPARGLYASAKRALSPCLASIPRVHVVPVPSWRLSGQPGCGVGSTQCSSQQQLLVGVSSTRQVLHQHYDGPNSQAGTSVSYSLPSIQPRSLPWSLPRCLPSDMLLGNMGSCGLSAEHMEQRQHGGSHFSSAFTTAGGSDVDTESLPDLAPCSSYAGSCFGMDEEDYDMLAKDVPSWAEPQWWSGAARAGSCKDLPSPIWLLQLDEAQLVYSVTTKKRSIWSRLAHRVASSMLACVKPEYSAA